ncbi:cupin domain-containing protein [Candidatus Bathyarchaeota archaeon]|jgi:quercetin dioxygenase-like cupin family protein|nr:cupin domain-containing protein [Candidatus Bathyarchaeota archaeon]
MKVFTFSDVEAKEADEGASKLKVRWLITKEMGAPNFAMRLFEMEPNGNSPLHTHPWEHEVFILEGEGIVVAKDGEKKIKAGSVIFIAPNELHQIKNNSKKILKFLCLVPMRDK